MAPARVCTCERTPCLCACACVMGGGAQVSVSRNSKAVADGIRAYDEAACALERRMPVAAQELEELQTPPQELTSKHKGCVVM